MADGSRLYGQGTQGGQLPHDYGSALVEANLPQYPLQIITKTLSYDSSFVGSRIGAIYPNKVLAFTRTASRGVN